MIEPLSMALVMYGILAWLRQKRLLTIVFFSLALLAKETAILFIAAFVFYYLAARNWRRAAELCISIVPYALLQILLWLWLGELGISAGEPFVWIPFWGWLMVANISLRTFLLISIMIIPIGILPTITGFVIAAQNLWRHAYTPYVFSMLTHGLFVLFLPTLTFRESSAMIRVVQGLAITILLYGASVKSQRILNYSILWIFSNVLIYGT